MLANINSLVSNYPECIKNIEILDSLYQVILKLSKTHPEGLPEDFHSKQIEESKSLRNTCTGYLEALAPCQKTKSNYNFTKLCLEHAEALKRYQFDHCKTLEDLMLSCNNKSNSQMDYSIIWECRLQRLFKEELYHDVLLSAKEFLKFCEKQGLMLKKLEYELLVAKIHHKSDAFQEALFQTLKIIEKAEEWQMTILSLEAKILLADTEK